MDTNGLNTGANILQFLNTILLLMDTSNNTLMQELQRQDTMYFERIVSDLKLIKNKLGIKEEE